MKLNTHQELVQFDTSRFGYGHQCGTPLIRSDRMPYLISISNLSVVELGRLYSEGKLMLSEWIDLVNREISPN